MTTVDAVLGIDLGTTAAKVLCLDLGSSVPLAKATIEYPSSTPIPGAHEQDPRDWWNATAGAIREVIEQLGPDVRIRSIGLSGHMHSLLLVDEWGAPVSPAMTWAERRVTADTARLAMNPLFTALTGNDVVDAFTAPKLAWVARTRPETLAQASRLVLAKDYLRFRLTGTWATDVTDAMGTLLFDARRGGWSPELWEATGASIDLAMPVVGSTDITGHVTMEAAAETGLAVGIPVVGGAGDVSATVLGSGVVRRDQISINVGTAAQVMGLSAEPLAGPGFVFGAASGDDFIVMSSLYAAGASIRWAERAILDGTDINAVAAGASPGASGLSYLPFMFGATLPRKNDAARAAFVGQGEAHGTAELARAVLEGVAFGCADAVAAVASVVGVPSEIRIVGGVAGSAIFREALASVVDAPVLQVPSGGSVRGAAILAGLGIGAWPDAFSAVASIAGDLTPPLTTAHGEYRAAYDRYRSAADRLV